MIFSPSAGSTLPFRKASISNYCLLYLKPLLFPFTANPLPCCWLSVLCCCWVYYPSCSSQPTFYALWSLPTHFEPLLMAVFSMCHNIIITIWTCPDKSHEKQLPALDDAMCFTFYQLPHDCTFYIQPDAFYTVTHFTSHDDDDHKLLA